MKHELNHGKLTSEPLSRRNFLKLGGAATLVGTAGISSAHAAGGNHIVIIGGGVGGATTAKYLKLADKSVNVTIIEKNPVYIRSYGSSEAVVGHVSLKDLEVSYDTLKSKYGIDFIFDAVTGFDPAQKTVQTQSGQSIQYDKLIVAPGIQLKYEAIPGYSEDIANTQVPSGWIAGSQTQLLADQLKAMPQGGTFILVAPPNPYRCPPGPYERPALVAEWMQKHNPKGKVIILDPKDNFVTDTTMQQGWNRLYNYPMPADYEAQFVAELKKTKVFGENDGVAQLYEKGILSKPTGASSIEWVRAKDGGAVVKLDVANKTIEAKNGTVYKYDVLNIVPPMVAGKIAQDMGLTDKTGFCPIDFATFESMIHKGVYVLGDASITPMPKSGASANTQAKVVALAALAALKGQAPAVPAWGNVCYALAGHEYGLFVVDVFELKEGKITNVSGPRYQILNASKAQNRLAALYTETWVRTFTADCFT
jgi:sulfide dehydrogenase [flavocytochrome c] flavoprotein subunit